MYRDETGVACWDGDTIKCLACRSKYILRHDNRPKYRTQTAISIAVGEYWSFEWRCETCGQLMEKSYFLKYKDN